MTFYVIKSHSSQYLFSFYSTVTGNQQYVDQQKADDHKPASHKVDLAHLLLHSAHPHKIGSRYS